MATKSELTWREPVDLSLEDDPDAKRIRSFDGLLDGFVRLAEDEDGQEILAYARRWGTLDLCRHGLPRSHPGVPSGNLALRVLQAPRPSAAGGGSWCEAASQREWRVEPCSGWRRTGTVFALMTRAMIAVKKNEAPDPKVWGGLHPEFARISDLRSFRGVPPAKRGLAHRASAPPRPEPLPLSTVQQTDEARRYVGFLLDDLLRLADLRLAFQWTENVPKLTLSSAGGLFVALVIQLVLAATGGVGFAICSGCARPYAPIRRPANGRRNYCVDCRDRKISARDAKRDYRARGGSA
ncbi:MAG: hypothetical protein WD556_06225 [Actinomycetota bacterium]